jgi:hypothetical protein
MIPWDNEDGCLETLCLGAVNQKYKHQLDCADALVKCNEAAKWDIAKRSKLKMRGFLSGVCRGDPNTGLRYAWSTENGRPGDIFPIKGENAYKSLSEKEKRTKCLI